MLTLKSMFFLFFLRGKEGQKEGALILLIELKQIVHYIECFRFKIHNILEQPINPVCVLQKRHLVHQSILVLT